MKIGIVGKGKMGMDLFHFFLEQRYQVVLIVRRAEDATEVIRKTVRQLERQKKRGILTGEEFQKKRDSFLVHTDFAELKDCGLVIETVIENKVVKKNILKEIEEYIGEETLLTTNSSSLDLTELFSECRKKERCLGLHFFYPVQYLNYVEVNQAPFTSSVYAERLKLFMETAQKKVLLLQGEGNYLLSRMITIILAYSLQLYQEGKMPIRELDQLIKQKFMLFGPFEMADATGLNIIEQSMESFSAGSHAEMIKQAGEEIKQAIETGYPGGNGERGLLQYEEQKEKNFISANQEELKQEYIERLRDLVRKELIFMERKKIVDIDQYKDALKEVFGIS